MKPDVANRGDVYQIVTTFYDLVRKDDLLGPIFNAQIADWEPHLQKITDFWDQILFNTKQYFGNPMEAHVKADKAANYEIEPLHFGKWLYLWINTIDHKFEGENANLLKNQARKMQTVLYIKMYEHKPANSANTPS